MRWCSFTTTTAGGPGHLGAVAARDDSGRVLDVGAWARSRDAETPVDLVDLVESSAATKERVTDLVRSAPEDGLGWVRPEEVLFLAPIRLPNSLRACLAYRSHVERVAARHGAAVPEPWDRVPVFSRGNRRAVLGPQDEVRWPSYSRKLDYECTVAAIVGRGGRDLDADIAPDHVFGYTIMNDWSARDTEDDELACWMGPAKAKDFATSFGPWVVTPDEWDPEGEHAMRVTVDGEVWSQGSAAGRRWTFGEMLARASTDEDLWPTDLLGSGTFGGGCGIDVDRWVQRGQTVELHVEGLGMLANDIV